MGTATAVATTGFRGAFTTPSFFGNVLKRARTALDKHRTHKVLADLSDRQLNDIGLDRAEFPISWRAEMNMTYRSIGSRFAV